MHAMYMLQTVTLLSEPALAPRVGAVEERGRHVLPQMDPQRRLSGELFATNFAFKPPLISMLTCL